MPFNFQLIGAQWNAAHIAQIVVSYEAALPERAWPNWVLGNHDNPRLASRIGTAQARVAAMLLLTLRGTPTLYYGEELGMKDVDIPAASVRDPAGLRQPGKGQGRDPERTPMRWDTSTHAGFTRGEPWLPVGAIGDVNVASQEDDDSSMLALYCRLLALRRSEPALTAGTIERVIAHGDVLSYERCFEGKRLFVALNMGALTAALAAPCGRVLLSTRGVRRSVDVEGELMLDAGEGVIVDLRTSVTASET
jgi:alpha-glucosidase